MKDQQKSSYWNYITPFTNLIYNTNPPTNINDLQNSPPIEATENVKTLSDFELLNNSTLKSVQHLSDSDKLLLLVCIKKKYILKPRSVEINKEILSVLHIIKEVFNKDFYSEDEIDDFHSDTSPLSILKAFYYYINHKLVLQNFTSKYQEIILSEFNTEFENLDTMNSKIIKSQLSIFNSLPSANKSLNESDANIFSKTVEDCFNYPTGQTLVEADEFINSQLDLDTLSEEAATPEEQAPENVSYFNAFTSGSLLSSIQGTISSVYQREGKKTNIIGFFNSSEPEKKDAPRILTQVADPFTGDLKIIIDSKYDELINMVKITSPYKAMTKYKLVTEENKEQDKASTTTIDYDNSVFLPSSNIKEYFHKRGIWSKIGLGIRDHYSLDNGDLHLYLSNKFDNDLVDHKLQKLADIKTNVIISFQVCDLRQHTDINVTDQSLNSKMFTDICNENLEKLLNNENSINKKITIDIPAIGKDVCNVDLIIEKVQKIFLKLDTEMNIFSGEMDNLLFITCGESFNLLLMCLPYLKHYTLMKNQDTKHVKYFNFEKYPVRRLVPENVNKTVTSKFSKVGILGLDINPSHSPLYYSMNTTKTVHSDMFYESLNWILYNNITVSLVANLYDCHQFPLKDKLLIDFLHPHLIRGLNVQMNQLDDDSNLLYSEDSQNISGLKVPINRRYEVVLMHYLINLVNFGYNLNDTIPLFHMVSKIYESRAFNNLTRTPQLKKKLNRAKKEFLDRMDKLHIDWKSIDPEVILKGFEEEGENKDVDKLHYTYYCLLRKQLVMVAANDAEHSLPDVKITNIWKNNEVYKFFISNVIFTSFNYPQKNMYIFENDKIENTEISKEKEQFLLVWKLRDFASNFVKLKNLPQLMSNIEERLDKDKINNTYISHAADCGTANADSVQCMRVLFKSYMDYKPPVNNRNLNVFKKEILDMIWDVYESSDDFIDDLTG